MGLPDGVESIVDLVYGHSTVIGSAEALQAEVFGDVVYIHSGTILIVLNTEVRSTDTALTKQMFITDSINGLRVFNVMGSGTACTSDVLCTETEDTATWRISSFVLSRTNAVHHG